MKKVDHKIRIHVTKSGHFVCQSCHQGASSDREKCRGLDSVTWEVRFEGNLHDATITFPNGTPLNMNVVQVPGGDSGPQQVAANALGVYKYTVNVGPYQKDPDIEVEPPISFCDLNDSYVAFDSEGLIRMPRSSAMKGGDFVRWISQGPPDMLDFTIQFDEEGPSPFVSGEYTLVSLPGAGVTMPRQTRNVPGQYTYFAILAATQTIDSGVLRVVPPSPPAKRTPPKKKTKK
jgi:hypothetical protein